MNAQAALNQSNTFGTTETRQIHYANFQASRSGLRKHDVAMSGGQTGGGKRKGERREKNNDENAFQAIATSKSLGTKFNFLVLCLIVVTLRNTSPVSVCPQKFILSIIQVTSKRS